MNKTAFLPLFLAVSACATHRLPYTAPEIPINGASLEQQGGELAPIDLSSPISARALADLAVWTNPDLKSMRAEAGVATAQIFSAGLLPDPTIGLGTDFPLNGTNEVTALALSTGLDLAGLSTRVSRINAAKANANALHQDILWAEWLTRQNAKLLASRIAWLEDVKRRTAEYRHIANVDLARAIRAAGRGDIAAVEVDARRLTVADASDRDRAAENQLAAARLDLNRLLGLAPAQNIPVAKPPLGTLSFPDEERLFRIAMEARTDLAALRAGLMSANAGVLIADASKFPLPSLSINAGRDTGRIKTIGPAVSFTLPVWNRARGELAVAKAQLSVLETQYKARAETVRADIGAAQSGYIIAHRQRLDVVAELSGLTEQAAKSDAAAARGDISETAAAATRLAVLDKQILADTLALAEAESAIALETAIGREMDDVR